MFGWFGRKRPSKKATPVASYGGGYRPSSYSANHRGSDAYPVYIDTGSSWSSGSSDCGSSDSGGGSCDGGGGGGD
jgi:hypothetical protein